MNCLIITSLLIILLIITSLCIYHINRGENFQYATLDNYYNRYYNKYYPRRKRIYNNYQKSRIDPGFGNRMWELESAPEWNDNDYNLLGRYMQPGDFGKLVSYLEDRNNATARKNLNV